MRGRWAGPGSRRSLLYTPPAVSMYLDIARYGHLFVNLFRRDLGVRYRGSLFGVAWTLVNPLVLMLGYWLLFSILLRAVSIPHYPLFVLSGLVSWIFFQSSIQMAAGSLLAQSSLVKQVRFPRQLVPFAVVATNLVTLGIMLAILIPACLVVVPETRDTFWAAFPMLLMLI